MKVGVGSALVDPLACPNCSGVYLHHGDVTVYQREKEDASTGLRVSVMHGHCDISTDITGNPSERRDGLTIAFRCEFCSATPMLRIEQSKGITFVTWESGAGINGIDANPA